MQLGEFKRTLNQFSFPEDNSLGMILTFFYGPYVLIIIKRTFDLKFFHPVYGKLGTWIPQSSFPLALWQMFRIDPENRSQPLLLSNTVSFLSETKEPRRVPSYALLVSSSLVCNKVLEGIVGMLESNTCRHFCTTGIKWILNEILLA